MSIEKPPINLLRGWPNPSLLPTDLVKKAANEVLSDPKLAIPGMLYAPDEGDHRLRETLAQWLSEFYSTEEPIGAERITITGGASQNIGCVFQTFTDPVYTRNVWIVAPTYMLIFRMIDDAGLHHKLRAVPEDEQGIDIDYLRKEIEKSERQALAAGNTHPVYKPHRPWQKFYKHIIYGVPTYANPSSKTTTLERRQQLVRLAREFDALIVTDDVYDQLQWPASPSQATAGLPLTHASIPRIVDIDRTLDGGPPTPFGHALSNGSFSKILGPGLRTGWAEAAPALAYGLSQTGTSRSGGAPSHIAAIFVAALLARGELQRHVFGTLQPRLADRYAALRGAVERLLRPLGAEIEGQSGQLAVVGGYFLWVRVPVDAVRLARGAKDEQNLVVAEGAIFEVPGDREVARFPNHVRLCFAWEEEDRLVEGVERLATVLKRMLDDGEAAGGDAAVDEKREAELANSY